MLCRRITPAHYKAVSECLRRRGRHASAHTAGLSCVVAGDDPGAVAPSLDDGQRFGHSRTTGEDFKGQRMKVEREPQHENKLAKTTSKNASQPCTSESTGVALSTRWLTPACGRATTTGRFTGPPRRLRICTASPSAAGSSSRRSAAGERSCAARA